MTGEGAQAGQGHEAGLTDIELGVPSSSVLFTSEKAVARPTAGAHNSAADIQRDAATYGVSWQPRKNSTFWIPQQALKNRHIFWLKMMGRIGWGAKAVIYAIIGGLACDNAVGNSSVSASPQGAFVLIGTAHGGRGALIFFAMCIFTYSIWRFWEGIIGQGYDNAFPKWKNFFKFRLSPMVSGAVYVAYNVLVIEVIPRDHEEQENYLKSKNWPNDWRDTAIGRAGLILVGIAFIAATLVQLEQFFTKSFHNTIRRSFPYMRKELWRPFRNFVLTTGHIGVLGRAGLFLLAAILFFRTVHGITNTGQSAFGNALAQLQDSRGGRAGLFIVGAFNVCYGLFATLNIYARIFPTPPPSGVKKARLLEAESGNMELPAFAPGPAGFSPMSDAMISQHPNREAQVLPTQPAPESGLETPALDSPLEKDARSSTASTSDSTATPKDRQAQARQFSPLSNFLQLQGNHPTKR